MIQSFFPSLFLSSHDEEFILQNEMVEWILEYSKTHDGDIISNQNGWQSKTHFYVDNESFSKYADYIFPRIKTLIFEYYCQPFELLNMWLNVNPKGAYNITHTHPNSDLSGVLWIDSEPLLSGNIVFNHPNAHAQYNVISALKDEYKEKYFISNTYFFSPDPGKMIIFPSNVSHYVEENQSTLSRISISFNLRFLQ